MRKLPIVPLAFGFSFAVISGALGQGSVNYTANPTNPVADQTSGGLSLPGKGASATNLSTDKGATDEDGDPSLQRLRSKDSLGQMYRDEGQLTAKARRREKILKVESTKQLPTSGTDPKFQGSLLHSSVTSIQDIGEKARPNTTSTTGTAAGTAASADADANTDQRDEGDPRFKAKRFVFTPMSDAESKEKELPRTNADSSPSPSPSASPTPSSH